MNYLYNNCDDLPIHNFYKVLETGNYSYLVVGYDGYCKVEFDKELAEKRWTEIHEEYCSLTNNNKTLMYLSLYKEILYLKTKQFVSSTLTELLIKVRLDVDTLRKYAKELSNWGYELDLEGDIPNQIHSIAKKIRFSENKLKLKESQLKELTSDTDDSEKTTLIEQTVRLEQILSRNEIDLKKTSVSKYIALFKEADTLVETRNKQYGK